MIYKRHTIFPTSTTLGRKESYMSLSGDWIFLCLGRKNMNNTVTPADKVRHTWAQHMLRTALGFAISYKGETFE